MVDPRNVKARDRLVYGSVGLTHYGTIAPFTTAAMSTRFQSFQGEIYWDGIQGNSNNWRYTFDQFLAHCDIELQVFESNQSIMLSKQSYRFKTAEEMVSKVKQLAVEDGGIYTLDVKAVIYNDISSEIPEIEKVSGYNAFFQSLVGGNRRTKMYSCGDSPMGVSEPRIRELIIQAFLIHFGVDISSEYDLNPTQWQRTLWTQIGMSRDRFAIPGAGSQVNVGNTTTRRQCRDALIPGPTVDVGAYSRYDVGAAPAAAYRDTDGGGFDIKPQSGVKALQSETSAISLVSIQKLTNGTFQALYLKPLGGIDTFMVSKFDLTRFRLEAVFDFPGKRSRFRIMSVPQTTSTTGHDLYCERMRRNQLFFGNTSTLKAKKENPQHNGWDIRFYLRDLITGDVSRMSTLGIKSEFSKKSWLSFVDFKIHRF